MLLLIAVCAVIVMASVIDDHSAALKKQIRLIPQKGFYYIGILQRILYRNREKWLLE